MPLSDKLADSQLLETQLKLEAYVCTCNKGVCDYVFHKQIEYNKVMFICIRRQGPFNLII